MYLKKILFSTLMKYVFGISFISEPLECCCAVADFLEDKSLTWQPGLLS